MNVDVSIHPEWDPYLAKWGTQKCPFAFLSQWKLVVIWKPILNLNNSIDCLFFESNKLA